MSAALEELAQQQEAKHNKMEMDLKNTARKREAEWESRVEELKVKTLTLTRDIDVQRGSSKADMQRISELEKLLEEGTPLFLLFSVL
jgi:hypothetical protein